METVIEIIGGTLAIVVALCIIWGGIMGLKTLSLHLDKLKYDQESVWCDEQGGKFLKQGKRYHCIVPGLNDFSVKNGSGLKIVRD